MEEHRLGFVYERFPHATSMPAALYGNQMDLGCLGKVALDQQCTDRRRIRGACSMCEDRLEFSGVLCVAHDGRLDAEPLG
jgi:hypothetical protein